MMVLSVSLASGYLAGIVANALGKVTPYFHDDYHFTECDHKS